MPLSPEPKQLKVVLLTRSGRPSGEMILQALTAAGKTVAGVVVEPRSSLLLRGSAGGFLMRSLRRHGVRFLWDRAFDAFRRSLKNRGDRLHQICAEFGIARRMVKDHNSPESEAVIRALEPDVLITANTRIITEPVIRLARRAALNVHTGKLPDYAGLDSIFWALYRGETEIGITVHFLTRDLDAGDILLEERVPVTGRDDIESLTCKAHAVGAQLAVKAVERLERECVRSIPQDASRRRCFSWPTPAQRRELDRRLSRVNHGMPAR